MKTNYDKFMKLTDSSIIDEKAIKTCLNCTKVVARLLYQELLRKQAVKAGKVINQAKFQEITLHHLVYDRYLSITVYLQSIMQNVLIDDENFIRLIHDHVHPSFSAELSAEVRLDYLNCLMQQADETNYLICQSAGQAIWQMLQDSKDLVLSGSSPTAVADEAATVIMPDPQHQ